MWFKKTINWNKYQSEWSTERKNPYLGCLIGPSFQGVNRVFVLSFEDNVIRKRHRGYFLPNVEIKDCNVIIDGKKVFNQPV